MLAIIKMPQVLLWSVVIAQAAEGVTGAVLQRLLQEEQGRGQETEV